VEAKILDSQIGVLSVGNLDDNGNISGGSDKRLEEIG
jgi:hypothetical protein